MNPRKLHIQHTLILGVGALCGFFLAFLFSSIQFDFSAEIARARELGITSKTILSGYPKSRDLLTYVSVLGFPVLSALIPWFLWSRTQQEGLRRMFDSTDGDTPERYPQKRLCLFLVIAVGFVLSLDMNTLYFPAFNDYVKAWVFLGEEGQMLEWAQRVLNGEVYGRDFFCLYGPMQIYPLALALEIFGKSVVTARVYTYVLNLAAYAIVTFLLYKTVRSKIVFTLGAIAYFFVFSRLGVFSPNTTILRFVLAILPLLLIHLHRCHKGPALLALAGVVTAQSLLFSQEAGLCSLAAIAALFLVQLCLERDRSKTIREATTFLAGFALSVGPMLLYLGHEGALSRFFESIYGYPKLLMLGYGCRPFPSFRYFIAHLFTGAPFFPYWVIFIYVFACLALLPPLLLGKANKETLFKLSLTLFGILLFRVALGRSQELNVLKVSHPAFLLCFLFLDGGLRTILSKRPRYERAGSAVMVVACLLSFLALFIASPHVNSTVRRAGRGFMNAHQKLTVYPSGTAIPEIERTGVFVDPVTARGMRQIRAFLSTRTSPGDYVYFFPNEPIYYFLFDRKNPTRFAMSYFAITSQQRIELVADLERKKPRYVIVSPNTWRVDNIPESVQVPEVVDYIRERYEVVQSSTDVVFLKRAEFADSHH